MPIKLTIWLTPSSDVSHTFEFEQDELVVGRDPTCHVQLPFTFVSGQHFTIVSEGSSYLVTDNGSTNGTVLNGRRLATHAFSPVRNGDLISVGEMMIQVDVLDTLTQTYSIEESGEEVRRMVWETLQARGARSETMLEVVAGPDRGARIVLPDDGPRIVIGAAPGCDLTLRDGLCHAHHLEIVRAGRIYEARPLNEQLTKVDGRPLIEPIALGQESRISLGSTQLIFRDPLQQYLDELSGVAEERKPPHTMVSSDVLSTQQIIDRAHYEEPTEVPPDFGPPDRPPVVGQPRMLADDEPGQTRASAPMAPPASRGWGAFEVSVVVVTALLIVGGLLAILVLFNVI